MADLYWRGSLPRNTASRPMPIVLYVLAILACGAVGAVLGWAIAGTIGLTGTPMALVAAFIGMVAATLLWIAGAAVLPRKR
jgi:hypothetical protein